MKLSIDDTRPLGVGETIRPGDCWDDDGELVPTEASAWGELVTGDELLDLRRPMVQDTVARLMAEYGIETDMGEAALRVMLDNAALLDRKHKDYGAGNIAAFGEYGVMVRMSDKFERLKTLLTNVEAPANESIEDTYKDIANYAAIALLVRRGLWHGTPPVTDISKFKR